jgi:hypothetical protein
MMRRVVQRTAQGAFWILASALLCLAMSVPAIINKLIFGSPF